MTKEKVKGILEITTDKVSEIDKCHEDDVPKMLCQYFIGEHISIDDLRTFGWKGNIFNNVKIIEFKKD